MRVHARNGSEWEGIDFYRRHSAEFAEFIEAYLFVTDEDAVEAGFYEADIRRRTKSPRFTRIETPSLVLRDADEAELWLHAFSWGQFRGVDTWRLLTEAGFGRAAASAVGDCRLVQLARGAEQPVVARDSIYPDRNYYTGSGIRLVDGKPTMFLPQLASGELLDYWSLLSRSWIAQPTRAVLFPSRAAAEAAGFADLLGDVGSPDERPGVWNFIVQDSSMRELWMVAERQQWRVIGEILKACGFGRPYSLIRLLRGGGDMLEWSCSP